jgi:hypothetical protein
MSRGPYRDTGGQRAVEETESRREDRGLRGDKGCRGDKGGREDRGLLKKQMAVERIEGRTVDRGS